MIDLNIIEHMKTLTGSNTTFSKDNVSQKDFYSIQAMIENNVFEAKKLLDFLLIHKPSHFFCVSTDKAANPVNVMGGSKKIMESSKK